MTAEIVKLSDHQHPDPYLEALANLSRLGKELERVAEGLRKTLDRITIEDEKK